MVNEISGKVRKRNRKPKLRSRVHDILLKGCADYILELSELGNIIAGAEVGEVHPTEYLIRMNQWSTAKGQLHELEKHHTLDVMKMWR